MDAATGCASAITSDVIAESDAHAYRRKMKTALTIALLLVGLLNFLPVLGVLSAQRIESAYGVDVTSPDLEILLRHRAVLFGIVGTFIIASALRPELRWPAIAAGLVSMVSFVLLAQMVGGYSAPIRKIVVADVVGIVVLMVAAGGQWAAGRSVES